MGQVIVYICNELSWSDPYSFTLAVAVFPKIAVAVKKLPVVLGVLPAPHVGFMGRPDNGARSKGVSPDRPPAGGTRDIRPVDRGRVGRALDSDRAAGDFHGKIGAFLGVSPGQHVGRGVHPEAGDFAFARYFADVSAGIGTALATAVRDAVAVDHRGGSGTASTTPATATTAAPAATTTAGRTFNFVRNRPAVRYTGLAPIPMRCLKIPHSSSIGASMSPSFWFAQTHL